MKYVSVILPTYNRKHILYKSVQSVLNQTHRELELIIVDDASTDDTCEYVESINDDRVRYIRLKENVGPAVARNIGVQNARYDLIAFEDSDDIWRSEKLERQIPYITSDVGLVYCAYSYEIEQGKKVHIPSKILERNQLSGEIFEYLCERNTIGTPTMLLKKECFKRVGGFSNEIKSLEDWDIAIRLSQITKVKFIDEVLVDAAYSTTGVNHNMKARLESLLYMMEYLKGKGKSIENMLNVFFDNLCDIESTQDYLYWKEQIKSKFVCFEDVFDLLFRMSKEKRRLKNNNFLLHQIFECAELKEKIHKHIAPSDVVAVYGLGELGVSIIKKLEEEKFQIKYVLDKNVISYKDYEVVTIDRIQEYPISKIVITVQNQCGKIKKEIEQYSNCECINVMDLI